MKTRKNPREEEVPKIDIITGKTDHAQKEEQSHKEDPGNIEKERRSKLINMCGAYGFSVKDAKQVYDRFEVVNTLEGLSPRWNIRPGQMNPIITAHSPNQISYMFWGLIPFFAKEKNYPYKFKTINAKAETAATLPTYRQPFRKRRCLIPAIGFYEPDKLNFTEKPFPWHYFQLKSRELFAFAGLYDVWTDPSDNKEIYSYTLITTEPNKLVGQFHPRMPVILHKEDEDTWVNPDIVEPELLQPLLKPYPADLMEEWAVRDEARNPRNDYPELIQPIQQQAEKMEQGRLI